MHGHRTTQTAGVKRESRFHIQHGCSPAKCCLTFSQSELLVLPGWMLICLEVKTLVLFEASTAFSHQQLLWDKFVLVVHDVHCSVQTNLAVHHGVVEVFCWVKSSCMVQWSSTPVLMRSKCSTMPSRCSLKRWNKSDRFGWTSPDLQSRESGNLRGPTWC